MRNIHVDPIIEILSRSVGPFEGSFPAPAVNRSEVGIRHVESDDARSREVTQQNVGTVFEIVVERSLQPLAKEIGVHTIVLLEGLLP